MLLATGLGVGWSPLAPGTWGTLWGLPLAWGLAELPSVGWRLAVLVALFLIGVPVCSYAADRLGGKDPGAVVLDEIVALPLALVFVPFTFWTAVLAFVLFRFFDISKLPPVGYAERLPRGWGVMADDIVAGGYAAVVLYVLVVLFPSLVTGG